MLHVRGWRDSYLAALALEVLHAFQLVRGAVLDDLLPVEVESSACHASFFLASPGDHIVHAGVLVRRAEARPLVPLVAVRGLPLTIWIVAPCAVLWGHNMDLVIIE